MKKSIFRFVAVAVAVVASVGTGCESPAQKVNSAQTNVVDANKKLEEANKEYLVDIENYRQSEAAKIAANNKSIAEFRTRIATEKKEARAAYEQKITALEQKNSDMKKKMDDYQEDGKEKWESFKREFSRDMEDLGTSFSNFSSSSNKK